MQSAGSRHWFALLLGFGLLVVGALAFGRFLERPLDDPIEALVSRSDLVVLAEVVEVEESSLAPTPVRIAHLRIRETWKGEHATIVDVPFDATLLWPQPPRYIPGETIVVFLRKDAGNWTTTTGTVEGTLHPATKEIGCLRWQIKQLI